MNKKNPRNNNCEVCNLNDINDPDHINSEIHGFNFLLWEFKNYKKAIAKDRHGLEVKIEPKVINNLNCNFETDVKCRNHIISISIEQLLLHRNTVIFCCTVKNRRKDRVHLTSAQLLHPDRLFTLVDPNNYLQQDVWLTLEPDAFYEFQIHFTLEQLITGSFKIPLACSFQDEKNDTFTIARSLVVYVDNQNESVQSSQKSPFTREPWPQDLTVIPPTTNMQYPDRYIIPTAYYRPLKFGLEDSYTYLSVTEKQTISQIRSMLGGERVTFDNYQKFWQIMLWMEETTHALMLQSYNMEKVTMEVKNSSILVLEVPGLAEKRPSVIPGDLIEIRVHEDHSVYRGVVKLVGDKTIDIYFVDTAIVDYIGQNLSIEMDVRFILGRLPYERMHEGVINVVRSGIVSNLFPDTNYHPRAIMNQDQELTDSDFFNTEVGSNPEQRKAVTRILYRTHPYPYIVFGPPGTGKTVTIVEAILQIKKRTKKRILVCAPANAACDMIAGKLAAYCGKKDLVRLHSNIREMGTISEIVRRYSNIDDEGNVTRLNIREILSFRIVVTTLIFAGGYKNYKPDYVFIDEAAQAMEPETAVAIGLLNPGSQIILAGDPKQLGPMISSKKCQEYKMDVSLLGRLMDYEIYNTYNDNFITMLRLNFRSHPNILEIPNELFYDNKLIAVSEKPKRDPISKLALYPQIYLRSFKDKRNGIPEGRAVEFCSVSSKERREGSSPSYFNPAEVIMVINYVKALTTLAITSEFDKVTTDQIGIVTPYKRQVFKIQVALKQNGFTGVEVGTTECLQGREKRVIIISSVRAQHNLLHYDRIYNLGFVNNEKRFNVAVTRAISKLIVIGCPAVLGTDREQWLRLIEMCERNGSYFGPAYARRDKAFKTETTRRMRQIKKKDTQYRN